MGAFAWTKLVLVDFLVPIAWPAVALASLLILKTQIRSAVERISEASIWSAKVKIESLPPPSDIKRVPLQENK